MKESIPVSYTHLDVYKRQLVNRPEIILADEPTGNLDSKTSDEVIALLKMTAKKYGQTIVTVSYTHLKREHERNGF